MFNKIMFVLMAVLTSMLLSD